MDNWILISKESIMTIKNITIHIFYCLVFVGQLVQASSNWHQEMGTLAQVTHHRLGQKSPAQQALLQPGRLQDMAEYLKNKTIQILTLAGDWESRVEITNTDNGSVVWQGKLQDADATGGISVPFDKNLTIKYFYRKNDYPTITYKLNPEQVDSLRKIEYYLAGTTPLAELYNKEGFKMDIAEEPFE